MSSTSINTCHDSCHDREIQDIIHKQQCCSSRTELAQYFAEDLYGSSRRPSSCCSNSEYCYHTDSTSLYGSKSSLSRNNSIRSTSRVERTSSKRRSGQHGNHARQQPYTSLRALNCSQPNSQFGSLTSIFDKPPPVAGNHHDPQKMVLSPSKVTIEHQSVKEHVNWTFFPEDGNEGGGGGGHQHQHYPRSVKYRSEHNSSPLHIRGGASSGGADFEYEDSTIVFHHQEGEATYNNCCSSSNYIQCNSYLDQDLQITSEDIHQYMSNNTQQCEVLNNTKTYPYQPTGALEFQYTNNFNNDGSEAGGGGDKPTEMVEMMSCNNSRRNSCKETNLSQNQSNCGESLMIHGTTPLSPTNINLSSSSNNINIIFNSSTSTESHTNEMKFINNRSRRRQHQLQAATTTNCYSTEAHLTGYYTCHYSSAYDNANMSSNSLFDKPLGINEIPSKTKGNNRRSSSFTSNNELLNQHHHNTRWQHVTSQFKFSRAFRNVGKKARKCAEYLRKK